MKRQLRKYLGKNFNFYKSRILAQMNKSKEILGTNKMNSFRIH